MKKVLVVLGVVVVLAVVVGSWSIGYKNKFVNANETVKASWAHALASPTLRMV